MKKIMVLIVAVAMVFSLLSVASFASERVYVSGYTGALNIGLWMGVDPGRVQVASVAFNAAVPFSSFVIPQYWASNGSNGPLVTYDFEIHAFDTDIDTSNANTPLFKSSENPVGDAATGIEWEFDSLPAGEYVATFRITGNVEGAYLVLPSVTAAFPSTREYFSSGNFGFKIGFDSESDVYLNKLSFMAGELETIERNLTPKGDSPQNLKDGEIEVRIAIPAGYELYALSGINSPTWGNQGTDSSADATVYSWAGDYDSTVAGSALAYALVEGHADNSDMKFVFDNRVGEGEYLVVFSAADSGSIGFWCHTSDKGDAIDVTRYGDSFSYYPGLNITYAIVDEFVPPEESATLISSSFDTFYVDDVMNFGEGDGLADAKLEARGRLVDGSDGSIQTLRIRGWIGFNKAIESFGYKIGDAEPVYGDFATPTEDGVRAAGGEFASRFEITVPVAGLTGRNPVAAVVKLTDGTVIVLDGDYSAATQNAANFSMVFIGTEGQTPETADTSMILFLTAAAAVALVILKKKAF